MNEVPIQYQRGWVEFYKLKFILTKDVLIPRPETELLVDCVLKLIKLSNPNPKTKIKIIDIGTGSGNIAISIACNLSDQKVNIIASDISKKALLIARKNAKIHGVFGKIKFIESNLIDNPKIISSKADIIIIVTNLPYIPTDRITYLDSSVKDFEPHIALDGGQDGFKLYRKLFKQIQDFRRTKSSFKCIVIAEIDYTHKELAVNEALNYFPAAFVEVETDLAHKQRILTIKF